MMKTFAFCVKPSVVCCLGPMFTGNCGCDRSILRKNHPVQCNVPRLPFLVRGRKIQFLEATASSFTKKRLVLGVNLNIPVLSVTVYTLAVNVIFVANSGEISPDQPVILPSQVLLPTPINLNRLEPYLNGYFADIISTLISGFTHGFALHFSGVVNTQEGKNLPSALANPTVVDKKLAKELSALRLAGPFTAAPFRPFRVSPLGLVPKKTIGEFRLIHHLSFPRGSSVNDGIATENTSVHYATVADAIRLIKLAGPGCFLAKTDVKNAFRIIPIRPSDHYLLGMKWRGLYYFDRCLPMGAASSCKTFEVFSTALQWIAQHKLDIDYILHLLDDFLLVSPSYDSCQTQLHRFLAFCAFIGLPLAPEKTFGPSTTLSFAGIELDTIKLEARLPRDKLQKCVEFISEFLRRKKVTLREIQSLVGLLNFACSVVTPGRAFLRRLIDLTHGVRFSHHLIKLNGEAKADLNVWLSFLSTFNGRSFFLDDRWQNSSKLNLFTDAADGIGFGAIFCTEFCHGFWPDHWRYRNIAILEFYPIILSLYLWGHKMANHSILFFTDNEALVYVINKQSCKDKALMFFVRKLVLVCLNHNILFKAKHIPGTYNRLADLLSRFQVQTFKREAPASMNSCATDIPRHLLPANWEISFPT